MGSDHIPPLVMTEDGSAFRELNDPNGIWKSTDSQMPVSSERQLELESDWSRQIDKLREALPPGFDAQRPYEFWSDGTGKDALLSTLRATFNLAEGQSSPIILDLDGDGIVETTFRDASGTRLYFDLDNSGYAERSGWVGADDGLLVRDLNANGRIDSGAELFGNHTLLADGTRAVNGFQALAGLDTNRDGVINASDAQSFASLRIWKDADGDGQTDTGELITLDQASVRALNVGYTDHVIKRRCIKNSAVRHLTVLHGAEALR